MAFTHFENGPIAYRHDLFSISDVHCGTCFPFSEERDAALLHESSRLALTVCQPGTNHEQYNIGRLAQMVVWNVRWQFAFGELAHKSILGLLCSSSIMEHGDYFSCHT